MFKSVSPVLSLSKESASGSEWPNDVKYSAKPAGPGIWVGHAAVFAYKPKISHLRTLYCVVKHYVARTHNTAYLDDLSVPADIAVEGPHNHEIAVGLNVHNRHGNAVFEAAFILVVGLAF